MVAPYYDDGRVALHVGHVLAVLAGLEAGSVQTCITSPPYWGLRAYGTDPQVWGGEPDCAHQFTETNGAPVITGGLTPKQVTNAGSYTQPRPAAWKPEQWADTGVNERRHQPAATCTRCGAWRGELGSEPTPEQFVANLVTVFRAVRRVLRDDGTLWVNLGDSYNNRTRTRPSSHQPSLNGVVDEPWHERAAAGGCRMSVLQAGLKEKDLVGIPWMVAFALRADGWYLRSDIIWSKPNPMPESVTDRPTTAHEHLFLLAKRADYYYDAAAVREPHASGLSDLKKMAEGLDRIGGKHKTLEDPLSKASASTAIGRKRSVGDPDAGRNRRSVWTIATEPYPEAHFATFPRKLVEPCLLAGTSARGQCPACGAPWERIVERQGQLSGRERNRGGRTDGYTLPAQWENGQNPTTTTTTGWRPTCRCHAGDPVPQVCLDPFAGSGTTLAVARWHQRRAIGVELSAEYARLIEQRLAQGVLL